MKKLGFLFPGQGAQAVGMGRDLYDANSDARALFDQADQLLGNAVSKLCFDGPEEELKKTVNTQIAIFVMSLAALRALESAAPELKPALACGLSLGEFTALVALESISFEEALKLVQKRGHLMEAAGARHPGTMASILGFSIDDCKTLCTDTGAELANINSPEQLVISGAPQAVERACALAKERGAKRAIALKVGGAFHSSLMADAQAGLEAALAGTKITEPKGVFIPNVTGTPVSNPEEIRKLLAKQLTSSVQWVKTLETIADSGVTNLLEIGPGRVLKGLARKTNSTLNVSNIGTQEELDKWTHPVANGCN